MALFSLATAAQEGLQTEHLFCYLIFHEKKIEFSFEKQFTQTLFCDILITLWQNDNPRAEDE
jgi:hypothetical protein